MIEDMIARVFHTRNVTHLAHWKTRSYAEHQALGEFYDGVLDLLDKLVECYQGYCDALGEVTLTNKEMPSDISDLLTQDVDWICENRDKIAQSSSALANIIDEICALYMRTIYKLDFLS